jgi:hypothetical protein
MATPPARAERDDGRARPTRDQRLSLAAAIGRPDGSWVRWYASQTAFRWIGRLAKMRDLTLNGSNALPREHHENHDPQEFVPADRLLLRVMVDASVRLRNGTVRRNISAPWDAFSSQEYWRINYAELHPEDQEIVHRVSRFFHKAFNNRGRAQSAIDVGSGTNIYPALMMLPWTEKILLTDHSASNVQWLKCDVAHRDEPWTWQPFWGEVSDLEGYNRVADPRGQLRQACAGPPGFAGIEKRSVFDLPEAQWQLGTMFFVAESITEAPDEFQDAIGAFVRSLQPESPFAAAFMAGSKGYPVAETRYPAVPITEAHVRERFEKLGVSELSVDFLKTKKRVREGYEGMIVATGIVGS